MSGTQTGRLPVAARAASPWWARLMLYSCTWLPVLAMFVVYTPRSQPLFIRLEECGELPQLTHWLMTFDRWNAAYFYVPSLLFAIDMLAIDALVVRYLRQRVRGEFLVRLWVTALALAAIPAAILVQLALLPPVFKMTKVLG